VRARAYVEGWESYPFERLPEEIGRADLIFNTVPALVLTSELLSFTHPQVLIIDLASHPGGTDFQAAQRLNRRAILAPGLPGKVAPKTAGEILARIYPPLIARLLERLPN